MQRGQGLILIFFGALLIYMSVFGLSGFGFQLAGNIVQADFNDLTGWNRLVQNGVVEINPPGFLHLNVFSDPGRARAYMQQPPSFPSQWTMELKLKAEVWGINGFQWDAYKTPDWSHMMRIKQNEILWFIGYDAAKNENIFARHAIVTDLNWHVWRITVDEAATVVKVYRDGQLIVTWNQFWRTSVFARIGLETFSGEYRVDYFYMASGVHPPSEVSPPPSDKGTVRVFASYDGNWVATSYTGTGPESFSGTTRGDGTPSTHQVAPGTYTVSGTYLGVSRQETVSVTAGQTVDAVLNFGGAQPTPPPPTDILEWINQLLANPTVKTLMLLGGIAFAGIGLIGLVMPSKSPYTPVYHPPR